jgi:serine/threonine protein kinase
MPRSRPPLRSPEEPDALADAPTMAAGAPAPLAAEYTTPSAIGGYRIVRRLGAGGMGIVFEAEQENPRRRVALKVIRGGPFVDDERVRLFQREAAALARLRHPGIGGILEAGRTASGEHFFAMELVPGPDLGAWLAARGARLDRAELRLRVRLLVSLCGAVHYAHLRGVIHRDLKPSNLVVAEGEHDGPDGLPRVRILDFGLARVVAEGEDAETQLTRTGTVMGTLPYMSPEQVTGTGDPADPRADVYALGVILYQALTGRRPLEVRTTSIVEAVRMICEVSPPPLAEAWSGPAAPDTDLQTIVGKALEKDPDQRYASAEALAEDLTRWLDERPIRARPPSRAYQLSKFVRRNRTLVAGACTTVLALVAGLVAATVFGLREAEQRRSADAARSEAQAVAEFQAAMLSGVDAPGMGRRLVEDLAARIAAGTTARDGAAAGTARVAAFRAAMAPVNATDAALRVIDEEVLARALAAADSQFASRPGVHARLLASIAATYQRLGLHAQAEPPWRAAVSAATTHAGPRSEAALAARHGLGALLAAQGRSDEAEPLLREVLAEQQRAGAEPAALATMNDLAVLLTDLERYSEAESLFALAEPAQSRLAGAEHPFTLSVRHNRAWAVISEGRDLARAESLMVPVLAARRRVFGDRHPETLQSIGNLGVLYRRMGRPEAAEPLYREDLAAARAVLGDEHPETAVSMTNLGRLLILRGRFAEAESLLARSVEVTRRAAPPGFFGLGVTLVAHGEALAGLGRWREAEVRAVEAHRVLQALRGDDDPGVVRAIQVVVQAHEARGRHADAARWRARLPETP